jgi:hypothetical protein
MADAQNSINHNGRLLKRQKAQNGRRRKWQKAQNGRRHKTAEGIKRQKAQKWQMAHNGRRHTTAHKLGNPLLLNAKII